MKADRPHDPGKGLAADAKRHGHGGVEHRRSFFAARIMGGARDPLDKVDAQVQDAVALGATLLSGGRRLTDGALQQGFFYAPTLLADGRMAPNRVIGTVNTAEFLLTLSISVTFLLTLGPAAFTLITAGLIIGGVVAAPFGAVLASRVKPRVLLLAVAVVLIATSLYSITKAWPIF